MNSNKYNYISFDYLTSNFGDEISFWKEIIYEAVHNIPQLAEKLEQELLEKNWKQVGEIAHQMKGVVQIFGLEKLAVELKEIQIDTQKEQNLDTIPQRVTNSVSICSKVKKELDDAYNSL